MPQRRDTIERACCGAPTFTAHRRQAAESSDVPDLSPDRLAIVVALQKITPELRQVIVLHHLLDLSVEEICAETGVPSGTVKARLVRGRKALAPHLSEFAQEAGHGPETTQTRGAKAVGRAAGPATSDTSGSSTHETTSKEGTRYV
ncbi:RNA polymerase sigma factor [Actinospica robiniae]|uniref:RNA polymerase sigma factor n=1 Tax=Actinospica robiniae TaxID=304901 RepID=UPI000401414C|nr:RNA polymerase sigma factor [Actinospica robiniae]